MDHDVSPGALRYPTKDHHIPLATDCGYTRYVSTSGNDTTGDGSSTLPWRTIKGAVAKFAQNSISCGSIFVKNQLDQNSEPSVYDEDVGIVSHGPGADEDSHIIIRGQVVSGKRPRIRPTTDGELFRIAHSYWTLENLEIDYNGRGGRAIRIYADATNTVGVVVRNNWIHNIVGCAMTTQPTEKRKADAIFIGGPHGQQSDWNGIISLAYILGNTIENIFLIHKQATSCTVDEANRDDAFGVLIWPKASDILIDDNTMTNISGDGVQCAGNSGNENGTSSGGGAFDPSDIEVVDNIFEATDLTQSSGINWKRASENAVDIKSCQRITITGNTARGFSGNNSTVGGKVKGGVFVAHYGAGQVRVENNHATDTCGLLSIGRHKTTVSDILVRANLFVSSASCEGGEPVGIGITKAANVDINHNTLIVSENSRGKVITIAVGEDVKETASGVSSTYTSTVNNIDIWSNILEGGRYWIDYDQTRATNFATTNNFYWSGTGRVDRIREQRFVACSANSDCTGYENANPTCGNRGSDTDRKGWCSNSATRCHNDSVCGGGTCVGSCEGLNEPATHSLYDVELSETTAPGYAETTNYTLSDTAQARCTGLNIDIGDRTYSWTAEDFIDVPQAPKDPGWRQNATACPTKAVAPTATIEIKSNPWFESDEAVFPASLWQLQGSWSQANGLATSSSAGSNALSLARATVDSDVSAQIELDGSTLSGVVARATGSDYYAMRLIRNEGIDIVRVKGGVSSQLASSPQLIGDNVGYDVRLRVRNTNPVKLEGWFGSTQIFDLTDTSSDRLTASGNMGLRSGSAAKTVFYAFTAQIPSPLLATPNTLLTSDNFDACVDDTIPSGWSVEGNYYCRAQRLRGESAEDLALILGIDAVDAEMRGRVRLTNTATGSGVVARAANGSYYVARIRQSGSVDLERVTPSGAEVLATTTAAIDNLTSYRVELQTTGWMPVELTVKLDSNTVLTYTDDSPHRLTSGSFGLLSGSADRTQFDDTFLTSR